MQRVLKYHLLLKVRPSPAHHALCHVRLGSMGFGPQTGSMKGCLGNLKENYDSGGKRQKSTCR